jgi:8-hydroxy-5-deazaflavin:NADPH oxidoreductase
MSTISIIGSGGMAAAIGGLAAKAGHTVEVMSRDAAKARVLAPMWIRRFLLMCWGAPRSAEPK